MGNICNRLSHDYAPTYKVQTSLILCKKDCSLRKGMSAKFPRVGYDHLADSLFHDSLTKLSLKYVHSMRFNMIFYLCLYLFKIVVKIFSFDT